MSGVNSFAYYDTLAIVSKISGRFEKTAISEVHLFAYLSCLLALYQGRPVADWEYGFVATETGSPFSPEIESVLGELTANSLVDEMDRYLTLTPSGQEEYAALGELLRYQKREEFIEAACSCILAVPLGVIRSAVTTDHDMKIARQLQDTRRLLSDAAVEKLHNAFQALSEEIGIGIKDLIVPAVVWLKFLALAEAEKPLLAVD